MSDQFDVLGCAALIRIAGLPVTSWLEAANPGLFLTLHQFDEACRAYGSRAALLADVLGERLIPNPDLARADRAMVLSMRRSLHQGISITSLQSEALAALVCRILGDDDPAADMVTALARSAASLDRQQQASTTAVTNEDARLSGLSWRLVGCSWIAAEAVARSSAVVHTDLLARRDDSEGHCRPSKRSRQHGQYLWQLITRSTTSSTPRDWLGHVALVAVDPQARPGRLRLMPHFADAWMENVHEQRESLEYRTLSDGDDGARIALAPLHRIERDRLRFWKLAQGSDTDPSVAETTLVRTDLLDTIVTAIGHKSLSLPEIEDSVGVQAEERGAFRGFLSHLSSIGAIQVSAGPARRNPCWDSAAKVAESGIQPVMNGWLDVYRQVTDRLPVTAVLDVQRSVQQVLRLLAIVAADSSTGTLKPVERFDDRATPILDLLAQNLSTPEDFAHHHSASWQPAHKPGSSYDAFLQWLDEHADDRGPVAVRPALLDHIGAPQVDIDWPVDCLLRMPAPGCDGRPALNEIVPAGTLDARFASDLSLLHGSLPQVQAYRDFLARMSENSGVPFVEILAPPLSSRAANAVRRPWYTQMWTGDPDLNTYTDAGTQRPEYVPLSAITIRRRGHRLIAEADGRRIWPIYHATRSMLPPWDFLSQTLLAAGPRPTGWVPRRLQHSLALFPQRNCMPRITIDDQLVVSPAQWRISGDLWDPKDSTKAKAIALNRLRRELVLPRWVVVTGSSQHKSRACDLDSLLSLRVFERTRAPVTIAEMIPGPDQLLIDGPGGPHVSELLLRLPCDISPAGLASTASARWTESARK